MPTKYYLDSCIWIDYVENRSDRFRPLGEWAFRMIKGIIDDKDIILYSDLVTVELRRVYPDYRIQEIFCIVPSHLLVKIEESTMQVREAILLSRKLNIPKNDALHAILARDNDAILVSRDKHFYELQDKITIKKPEDLI